MQIITNMITHFVLFDTFSRMFVRGGHGGGWTNSISAAKHFSSKWRAERYLYKMNTDDISAIIVKRIEHY